MARPNDPTRPWKMATAALALTCAGLVAFIAFRPTERIDATGAAGKVAASKKAPVEPIEYGPAAVSLRKFDGPDELVSEAEKSMRSRLEKAGNLTYKAAGVKSITVDTRVKDRSKISEEDTEVTVTVQLLVLKQPGNSLLATMSATGSAGLGSGASENFIKRTKVSVMEAAAESTFEDLVNTLKEPAVPEDDE